ncbi:DUF6632 domain-containing protein [Nocardia fluminea]|uniref:DUF6632 domain-containing protein n=1 Tax=Nocardia fluminea TaxID=134984 RepID=UPI0033CDB2DB
MTNRERWLRIALIIVGIGFLIGLYPMFTLWESGFRWQPQHPRYEHMITAIYAVLGVFCRQHVNTDPRVASEI